MSDESATGGSFLPTDTLPLSGVNHGSLVPTERPGSKEYNAKIARNLAYGLIAMLGVSVLCQYGILAFLFAHGIKDAVPNFEHLFNTWLPVISGLASSAVTYYLTKEKK